jgi:hypothetical protein
MGPAFIDPCLLVPNAPVIKAFRQSRQADLMTPFEQKNVRSIILAIVAVVAITG